MKKIICLALLFFPFMVLSGPAGKEHSVLSSGEWYKIGVVRSGIHTITFDDLVSVGVNPSDINPATIRIFGNGGKMLPEKNSALRADDLTEITIALDGMDDLTFDQDDRILFYAEGPVHWNMIPNSNRFSHTRNLYSDTVFYYFNSNISEGKRITEQPSLTQSPSYFINKYSDYVCFEEDITNFLRTGRHWTGQLFVAGSPEVTYPYNLQYLDPTSVLKVTMRVLGESRNFSSFHVSGNGDLLDSLQLAPDTANYISVKDASKTILIINPPAEFTLGLKFMPRSANAQGWLDHFELNFFRQLRFRPGQMSFRDPGAIGMDCAEFIIKGTSPQVEVWDVTVSSDVKRMQMLSADTIMRFRISSDSLREYVIFDRTDLYHPVIFAGPVPNQDLHAMEPSSLIIVTHPLFEAQAEQLAAFHRGEGLTAAVVRSDRIWPEFSCGVPDPTGIRDFIRMLYKKSNGTEPKYLLLFGDGSYDPKNRIPGNNNFIPTFQSDQSQRVLSSFICDDYYGLMGDAEGEEADGNIDVAVGRLPVSTVSEAQSMVDKIMHYTNSRDVVFGDWRNCFTFLADDGDNNLHFRQSEILTDIVKERYPKFNVQKIYNDAYIMTPTPGGDRLPQVNAAINKAISDGTILFNYNGHGGEDGLSAEKVLMIPDILSWKNYNRLPVFVTATCEFSRFDNPERLTAGEMVILHPEGGAIALFTTTRLAYASDNFRLDTSFISNLYQGEGMPAPRMGDLIRLSKNENGNSQAIKNFVLLGDPAQKIAFPEYNVVTTSINDQPLSGQDTALGLSRVKVKGEVLDPAGNHYDMEGKLQVKVYDKETVNYTVGNPAPFITQNNIIFRGEAEVKDGFFEFDFLVPAGVVLQLGKARISYYVMDSEKDGSGWDDRLIVGGKDPAIDPVNEGPEITMYMDDPSFINGDRTRSLTTLYADIEDEQGINTIGLGIGHEIICVPDDDAAHSIVMNDIFRYEGFSWQKGSLSYEFSGLAPGNHTMRLTAWDMYNNPSQKEINFWVSDVTESPFSTVYNYPNPFNNFRQETKFYINASSYANPGNLVIQIFDRTGSLVSTITRNFPDGVPSDISVSWDGCSESGSKLMAGLYLYRVILPQKNGSTGSVSGKMLIMN